MTAPGLGPAAQTQKTAAGMTAHCSVTYSGS